MKNYKYTKEFLEPLVKDSISIRDLIKKLGKKNGGGLHAHLTNVIKYHNIDTSHFLGMGWNKGGFVNKPHTMETFINEVLCLNGKGWKSSSIKEKLFEFNLKDKKCNCCKLERWLEKEIPLELHHIDGDKQNNELSNLEILCPNCHSFTDNYRGKNINTNTSLR